jgi:hypothetical protein
MFNAVKFWFNDAQLWIYQIVVRTGRIRQAEQDRQNWTGRTGQAEQDRQDRTIRTGQTITGQEEWKRQNWTSKTGHSEQDWKDRERRMHWDVVRKTLPEQDCPDGGPGQSCHNRAVSTGLRGQDSQGRIRRIGQTGHDRQYKTGQEEQDSQN